MMTSGKAAAVALLLVACAHLAAARQPQATLYDVVKSRPELSQVFAKIEKFGLGKQFQNPKLGITAFIPSNDAYDKIAKAINDNPAILDNAPLITQALAYHILNKPYEAEDFKKGTSTHLTALPNSPIAVQYDPKSSLFKVGAYNVVERNIKAGRSVIHVIDGFLVAPALMPQLVKALREAKAAAP